MRSMAATLALAILLIGCSAGADDETSPTESAVTTEAAPEPSGTMAEACPQIQDALDAVFADKVITTGSDYDSFAKQLEPISEQLAIDEGARVAALLDITRDAASNVDADPLGGDDQWFDAMRVVTSECEAVGSPLD